MVVVRYRDGWGQTPWTRVEEAAIKDRFLQQGWEWLLFVMVDEASTPPAWLPKSEIRLNYETYGFEQLLGAIKLRAQKLGSVLRAETPLEKALRLEKASTERSQREQIVLTQGRAAVGEEHERLRQTLDEKIEHLNKALTALKIEHSSDGHDYLLKTSGVSLNFYLYPTYPPTQSRIVIQEWNGPLILHGDRGRRMFFPGDEPKAIAKEGWHFDYQGFLGWCWRQGLQGDQFLTTSQLADRVIERLLDLHARFERGEVARKNRWG